MIAPRYYAVIGRPISHSRSPWLHHYFGRLTQRHINYAAITASDEKFNLEINQFFRRGGSGLNVTVPFKAAAISLADSVSAFAKRVGNANTLLQRNNHLYAYNTDGSGFIIDLLSHLTNDQLAYFSRYTIALLGAGSAATTVAHAIADKKPANLWIINRTYQRAANLAQQVGGIALSDYRTGADIVINASSAGLGNESPTYPSNFFSQTFLAYDLSYGASALPFIEQARRQDVRHITDGVGMLVRQAALAFSLWEGVMPCVTDDLISTVKQG